MTSDTQNDTSELREQVQGIVYSELSLAMVPNDPQVEVCVDELLALIAKREQAAELRGRESETEYWRQSGFLPLFDADKRLTELEIQATKPEKEG